MALRPFTLGLIASVLLLLWREWQWRRKVKEQKRLLAAEKLKGTNGLNLSMAESDEGNTSLARDESSSSEGFYGKDAMGLNGDLTLFSATLTEPMNATFTQPNVDPTNARRVVAHINLPNCVANMNKIQEVAQETKCKVMAVVKANAYGHGAVQVARALASENEIDYFGVATLPEALELRKGLEPDTNILVLGPTVQQEWALYSKHKIDIMVDSGEMASELIEWTKDAKECGTLRHAIQAHVMLNTGMSRMGLQAISSSASDVTSLNLSKENSSKNLTDGTPAGSNPKEGPLQKGQQGVAEVYHGVQTSNAAKVIKSLYDTPNDRVKFVGMCTHMSEANKQSSYTEAQFQRFYKCVVAVLEQGVKLPMVHLENSESLLAKLVPSEDKKSMLDMGAIQGYCRTGGAIYGQRNHDYLLPCITLTAQVRHVHIAKKGSPVGYDRTWIAKRDSLIATIAIGFADGYSRYNSNKGSVGIRGKIYNIAGKVCMDMMMVDLGPPDGDGQEVTVGDYAVMYGEGGPSLKDVAELLDTAQSDLTCVLGRRVLRKYVDTAK